MPNFLEDLMKAANMSGGIAPEPGGSSVPAPDEFVRVTIRFASMESRRKAADAILTAGRVTVKLRRDDLD